MNDSIFWVPYKPRREVRTATGTPYRFCRGEFHPEPLTDPDLTLSRHPARAIARRLPLPLNIGFLPLPVDPITMAMACSLRSTGITPLHNYYEAVRR